MFGGLRAPAWETEIWCGDGIGGEGEGGGH